MYHRFVFRELLRRKSRTATIVLTIAIITSILILYTAIMDAYSSGIYKPFGDTGSDMILQKIDNTTNSGSGIRMPFGEGLFDDGEIRQLSGLDHVMNISPSLVLWDFGKHGFTTIEGIEPESQLGKRLSSEVKEGRFVDRGIVVLESHFANFNHLKTGDDIVIGNDSFRIAGILSISDEAQVFSSNIYMTKGDAQKISGINGYDRLYAGTDLLSSEDAVKDEIAKLDSNITMISGDSISASLSNVVRIFDRFRYVGTGLIILVTVLILAKISAINLLERKKDIAVLRTVGWTGKDIMVQLGSELFIQASTGFLLGLAISFSVLAFFGSISIRIPGSALSQHVLLIPITIGPGTVFDFFVIVLLVSLIVTLFLAGKISEIRPSENLRSL